MTLIGTATLAQFFKVTKETADAVGTAWIQRAPPLEGNEQAIATCRALTAVLESATLDGFVFVVAIEMDADAGRFPGLLDAFFADPYWDYDTRFFVREMRQASKSWTSVCGLLTAEGDPAFVERMLRWDDGIRWAANLRVEGIQIRDDMVAHVLDRLPLEDSAAIEEFGAQIRLAFRLSANLDVLHVYCRDELDLSAPTRSQSGPPR